MNVLKLYQQNKTYLRNYFKSKDLKEVLKWY